MRESSFDQRAGMTPAPTTDCMMKHVIDLWGQVCIAALSPSHLRTMNNR